jgi:hypothetical protein
MSLNVDNVKEFINNLAKKGVTYIMERHSFLNSNINKSCNNVTNPLVYDCKLKTTETLYEEVLRGLAKQFRDIFKYLIKIKILNHYKSSILRC